MIFASFIANGMFNVPNVIDETFGEQTIEVTAETSSTQEQYQDVVAQIKTYDIATQHKMFKTISALLKRSEERRVGKECRSQRKTYHYKKKSKQKHNTTEED